MVNKLARSEGAVDMLIWLLRKSLQSDPVDGVKSTTFERFSHHIKAQQMYSFQKEKWALICLFKGNSSPSLE